MGIALLARLTLCSPAAGHPAGIPFGSSEFFLYILYAVLTCCFAGLMSGLTVGYTSIDQRDLAIKRANGSAEEIAYAQNIQPILDNKHLLLATLLTANALAMESLPLFLDAIMPASLAIIISTTVVLVFGEVLPQALCVGKHQLRIASAAAPVVRTLIVLFYPVCYPISRALDFFLGEHSSQIRLATRDLKALIDLHTRPEGLQRGRSVSGECILTPEEIHMLHATIDLRTIPVESVMTPVARIFGLATSDALTQPLLARIARRGFSKLPVMSAANNCLGVLAVKRLLDVESLLGKTVAEAGLPLAQAISVISSTTLLEALCIMQQKKTSVLFVSPKAHRLRDSIMLRSQAELLVDSGAGGTVGMVTLKDIFEQLVKGRLEDGDQLDAVCAPGRAAPPPRPTAEGDAKLLPLLDLSGGLRPVARE